MNKEFSSIIEKIRDAYPFEKGLAEMSIKDISESINIPEKTIKSFAKDEKALLKSVLEFERESFKVIFDEHNFDGVNAIDILLTVSKEMATKFNNISPAITFDLKSSFPDIYQSHFEIRRDFIFMKIKINLQKGISQGMYREDLSIELISRLYIARLIDIHDPNFFPPEEFSFEMLFDVMFENLIRSIATDEGLKYFEKKRKGFKF